MVEPSPAPVLAARLSNQHLSRPLAGATPASIVAWFGAMQAQEYGPARWAIGQRARGVDDAAVARAFDAGEIVRTHAMRPTWHFVAPEDLRWIQMLTGPRVRAASASVLRANELDARVLARSRRAIARALEGGRFLTRQELAAALDRARIPARSQRLAYIVMDAELEAVICSGPRRGKQFTYALVDQRVPPAETIGIDEALGRLAMRYFQSHGPATIRDFVWWSGLRAGDARRGVEIAALRQATIDGVTYVTASTPPRPRGRPASAHLLPIYDEYVNAYRDRGEIMAGVAGDSIFMHYLIVDGRLAGTWLPAASGGVDVRPRARLTKAQRDAVDRAVARYRAFRGAP